MGLLSRFMPPAFKHWILAELGDGEEKFTRIFHTSADWIVITRISDSKIVEANAGFETISGYSRDEVIGHPIKDFNVWAVPEQRVELVQELMAKGNARDYLAKMRTKDGSIRDCLVNCALIALKGNVNSHAVWIARDITDQLIASEQSSAAFRLTPDCMTISRLKDGTYIEVNSAFEKAMGMHRKDIIGKTAQDLNVWNSADDRSKLVSLLRQNTTVIDYPAQIKLGDGKTRDILINSTLFESRGEELMIALLHDVTELRAAAKEILNLNANLEHRVQERTAELQAANLDLKTALATLNIAKDQIVQSEKLAALGSLVAGVAHELNTPIGNSLTVASTQEEMLNRLVEQIDTGLKRSDLKKFVSEISMATDILTRNLMRAGDLVTSFKHVAVDRTSSKRRRFSLAELTSEILLTMNPTLSKKKCTIQTDLNDAIILDSFPGALGQVLINLINNAIVHGFDSDYAGMISISANFTEDQHAIIEVQDNGKGIHPDNLRRVFEPFFTTRLGQGGSGMGLHIVHNLVTGLLGGKISVLSDQGIHGTTFKLILPLEAPYIDADNDTNQLPNDTRSNM
ncbi:PAS domain-containing sensor histidine kinase [Undibacterium sp. Dicai25W]|uniref:PAS domain-containing sensor histidine kinase n=1 Tax=Undibacterium sp. Dicai25W TaxID=3413034 RepID=UPI003BF4356A